MSNGNSTQAYDSIARALHWVSALFFILALILGLYFSTLDYRNDKLDYVKFGEWIHWHKTFGVLVFMLVFYRLYHRVKNPPPVLPAEMPVWMRFASVLSHISLYGLIFVLGLTGLIASDIGNYNVRLFGVWLLPQFTAENRPLADEIFKFHMWLGNFSAFLVATHIGASLYHHFVVKDRILLQMLKGESDPPSS